MTEHSLPAQELLLRIEKRTRLGSWEWAMESDTFTWSAGFARLLRLGSEKGQGSLENLLCRIHPADRSLVESAIREVLSSAKPGEIRHRVLWPDGSVRIIRQAMELFGGDGGREVRLLGIGQDVTGPGQERRQAASRQGDFLEYLFHPFYIIDAQDYTIKMANAAARKMANISATASLQGITCHELTHKSDSPCHGVEHLCPLEEVKKSKQSVIVEHIHYDQNGRPHSVEVHGHPIFDPAGNVVQMIEYSIDISSRKKMEEALRLTEEYAKTIVNSALMGIIIIDRESHRILDINPAGVQMIGLPKEEIQGKTCHEVMCPTEVGKCPITDLNQTIDNSERIFVNGDGDVIPILKTVVPSKLKGRDCLIEMFFDITERKRMENELLEQNRRFAEREEGFQKQNEFLQTVIESLTHPFYVIDANDYSIIYANSASGDDWMDSTCYALTHKSDRPCGHERGHVCPLDEVRRTKKPMVTEHVHYDKDGNPRHVEVHGYPILDREGRLVQMIEYSLDITEMIEVTLDIARRKRIEEALRKSEKKFRILSQEFNALLDAIPDILLVISSDLKVRWANRGAVAGLGKDIDTLIGEPCYRVLWNESRPCKECPVTICYRTAKVANLQVSNPDGTIWDLRAFPIKGEDGGVTNVIEVASDITAQVSLQQEAMRAGHLALMGELAAGVAHEINNPMNTIINFAQIMSDELSRGEQLSPDIPIRIIKEGDRVSGIVRSLLSFARKSEQTKTPVSVAEIMDEVLALTETQIRKDGIALKVEIPRDLPKIRGNFQQIQQVLLNIINNARYALNKKYSGADPQKILKVTAEEIFEDDRSWVKVSFLDQGIGIPADIINKVVHPFFSTKLADRGTGLGLSISHGIITDHSGKLTIESEEGKYTRVSTLFPVENK